MIGALSFAAISAVIGKQATSLAIITLFLSWAGGHIRAYLSALKQEHLARQIASAKEAQRRRSQAIASISAAVGENIIQITTREKEQIDAYRKAAERRRQRDVRDIVSCIGEHLIAIQDEEEKKKEEEEEKKKQEAEAEKARLEVLENLRKYVNREREKARQREQEVTAAKAAAREQEQALRELQSPIALPYPLSEYNPLRLGFTCVGTTLKGKRCGQCFLSNDSLSSAARRLELMRTADPGDSFEFERLKELADWMLCRRWHRDKKPQGAELAWEWYHLLQPAREELRTRKRRLASTTATPRNSNSYYDSSFSSASSGFSFGSNIFSSAGSNRSMDYSTGPFSSPAGSFQSLATEDTPSRKKSKDPSRNLTSLFGTMSR